MIISTFQTGENDELALKQNKLTGEQGQVVGFDENGNAIAQDAPDAGVITFNGRNGTVVPQAGDYTAEQVGADPVGSASTVQANLNSHTSNKSNPHAVTAAQVGASPTGHTHDDRYYTESEIDTKLSGKSDTSHTHNYAGSTSAGGSASSAIKLSTARTIRTNLASTSTASFDGSANVTPGVTGTLGTANGGTGGTSSPSAIGNLVSNLSAETTLATDDYIPFRDTSGSTGKKITAANLRNYLVPTWAQASSKPTYTASEVGALPISGGTLTGDLRIKGSGNYGTKINLGDGDYVHIAEPEDDCLEIKAKKINFVISDTTDSRFTLNGEKISTGNSDVETKFNFITKSVTMGLPISNTVFIFLNGESTLTITNTCDNCLFFGMGQIAGVMAEFNYCTFYNINLGMSQTGTSFMNCSFIGSVDLASTVAYTIGAHAFIRDCVLTHANYASGSIIQSVGSIVSTATSKPANYGVAVYSYNNRPSWANASNVPS